MQKFILANFLLIIFLLLNACGSTNKTTGEVEKKAQEVVGTTNKANTEGKEEATSKEEEEQKKTEEETTKNTQFITEEAFNDIGRTFPDLKIADLDAFLLAVRQDVEQKNWGGFFSKCSKAHYAQQITGSKVKAPHYIATVLGIATEGNTIQTSDKGVSYANLKELKTLTFDSFSLSGPRILINGKALLKDDSSLATSIYLEVQENQCRMSGPI